MTKNRHRALSGSGARIEPAKAASKRTIPNNQVAERADSLSAPSVAAASGSIIESSGDMVSAAEVRRVVEIAIRELAAALDQLPAVVVHSLGLSPDRVAVVRDAVAGTRSKMVLNLTAALTVGDDDPLA